jgi:hypothetical protein
MFCGKCGKQLEDDEIVCPWCGEPTGVEAGEKITRISRKAEDTVRILRNGLM